MPYYKEIFLNRVKLYTSMEYIGVGNNSILGGLNLIYTMIAAICVACMNINKVSRVKH